MSKDVSMGVQTFEQLMAGMARMFMDDGDHVKVDTGHWQSIKNVPHTQTRELSQISLMLPIAADMQNWQAMIHPNLPWAEDHFQERVGGKPLNPGEQYKNWPWYRGGVEDHKKQGEFSHTYMERFWPRYAGRISYMEHAGEVIQLSDPRGQVGIRYPYGDLNDLLTLLAREPYTRQAYLPIWFPEDLHAAAVAEQRVPCSLGYHFMLREGKLHCFYPMRSVDFLRYLRDDIYMAGRLTQWVIEQLKNKEDWPGTMKTKPEWQHVVPGDLHFAAASLHIFEGDMPQLKRIYG